jgi:hypothetical protein
MMWCLVKHGDNFTFTLYNFKTWYLVKQRDSFALLCSSLEMNTAIWPYNYVTVTSFHYFHGAGSFLKSWLSFRWSHKSLSPDPIPSQMNPVHTFILSSSSFTLIPYVTVYPRATEKYLNTLRNNEPGSIYRTFWRRVWLVLGKLPNTDLSRVAIYLDWEFSWFLSVTGSFRGGKAAGVWSRPLTSI